MGIDYYLYHEDTKTFVRLGKRLSNLPGFEGNGLEAGAFLAAHFIGSFFMRNDHGAELPQYEEDGWTEFDAKEASRRRCDVIHEGCDDARWLEGRCRTLIARLKCYQHQWNDEDREAVAAAEAALEE
jgi:hypothetical protein